MPRTPRSSESKAVCTSQTPYSAASTRSSTILQTPTTGSKPRRITDSPVKVKVEYIEFEVDVKPFNLPLPEDDVTGMSSSSTAFHPGTFVISRILARSLEPLRASDGEMEHYYLVRWEGYGPDDDTWEPKSNLMQSSAALVNAFESRPFPLRILGISANYLLVRFGHEDAHFPPSPLAHTQWLTEPRLRASLGDNAPRNLDHQILVAKQKHQEMRKIQEDRAREKKRLRREQVERGRLLRNQASISSVENTSSVEYGPRPTLLAILDKQTRKAAFTGPTCVRYLCEYTVGSEEVQEWKNHRHAGHMFGSRTVVEKLAEWQREQLASKAVVPKTNVQSEYEKERLRRIQENQILIKDLGL